MTEETSKENEERSDKGGSGETISSEEAREALAANDAHAIDIRGDEQWREGHIPGAHHIPEDELESRSDDFPTEGQIIIADEDGEKAGDAAATLRDAGHDAVALEGGMDAWRSDDSPMQPSRDPHEDAPI